MAEVKVYTFIGKKRNNYDTTEYISGQQFCDALTKAEASSDTDIKVSVNSGGGSVTDGYAMIAGMQKCTKPVTAVIDGYAASMGYFVCLGAKRIEAAGNSILMLHSVQGSAQGSPDDLIAEAEVLKKFNATVATLLAARTGLSEAEVTEKYLGKEAWFTASEALDLKLIDAITEYNAENIPAVTAGMSYEEATQRFAAMHSAKTEENFITKAVAAIKAKFGLTEKEPKAMLSEVEENSLCNILWDVRMAADDADCALESAASPEVKALLDEIMKANSAFVIEITNLVYGEELTEPAAVEAKAKEYLAKANKALPTTEITAKAIEAATQFVATELKTKTNLLAEAADKITALESENKRLAALPGASDKKPLVDDDKAPKLALNKDDLEAKFYSTTD